MQDVDFHIFLVCHVDPEVWILLWKKIFAQDLGEISYVWLPWIHSFIHQMCADFSNYKYSLFAKYRK